MENSSSVRRRTSRNMRECTPDPSRGEKITRAVSQEPNESRYIVKGILNVGPPSPSGSISSSSSSGPATGSHAYRAKILRYLSEFESFFGGKVMRKSRVDSQVSFNWFLTSYN